MTKTILCPVDGTAHATHAVAAAAELARLYDAALLLCAVNVAHGGGRGPMVHQWSDEEAQKILADAAGAATKAGRKPIATDVVSDREAASGIVAYAEMNKVDHIVMGTGDRRGLSRLVLGSVAGDVAAKAHCTVTVAR